MYNAIRSFPLVAAVATAFIHAPSSHAQFCTFTTSGDHTCGGSGAAGASQQWHSRERLARTAQTDEVFAAFPAPAASNAAGYAPTRPPWLGRSTLDTIQLSKDLPKTDVPRGDDREVQASPRQISGPILAGDLGSEEAIFSLTSDRVGRCQVGGRTLAFPGAQGFGRFASGGRGGKVVFVTNLNDTGPGSLRHAVERVSGSRTVIFRTGGIIELTRDISASNNDLTIAGQTAPGNGVTLKNAGLKIASENHIVRGLRSRPGDSRVGEAPHKRDAFTIIKAKNVILDHNSATWSVDENISVWRRTSDITISNNLIAEGLDESIHSAEKPRHSKGLLIGPTAKRISVFRNVLADNHDRNVRWVGPQKNNEMINNYIFNCDWCTHVVSKRPGTGREGDRIVNMRIINNYFDSNWNPSRLLIRGGGLSGAYVIGNRKNPRNDKILRNSGGLLSARGPTAIDRGAILPANQLRDDLLNDVGANWPLRDAVDTRIINEISRGRTFGFAGVPDSPSDVGGYPPNLQGIPLPDFDDDGIPDEYEARVGGDPRRFDSNRTTSRGFTLLEHYINGLISSDFDECR